MGQVRHGSATTTHAVRAAIQRSQASLAQLSRELGINAKTVAKRRKRQTVEDLNRAEGAALNCLDPSRGGDHRGIQAAHLVAAGRLSLCSATDDPASDAFGAASMSAASWHFSAA